MSASVRKTSHFHSGAMIAIQPTAPSRRKTLRATKGRAAQSAGRPAGSDKKRLMARSHQLSKNVSLNLPHSKKHSKQ